MKPEDTVDFHIRWAWAKIARIYNQEASKSSGTMSIGYALLNVDKEGTPSTQLGPKMGMESRSLTRTLKTMEDQGLIRRETDEVDRRKVLVYLTPEGLKMRERTRNTVIHFNKFIRDRIDPEKLEVLAETMTEINAILDQNDIFKDYQFKD
jgi:DNA-binding MarR family transcriptional regulator